MILKFVDFLSEGRSKKPEETIARASHSGQWQYILGARLATREKKDLQYGDVIRGITDRFSNADGGHSHRIEGTSVTVGRVNAPGVHDIQYSHNGQPRRVEVVGGPGKMLWSARTGNKKVTMEELHGPNALPEYKFITGLIGHAIKTRELNPRVLQSRLADPGFRRLTSPFSERKDAPSVGKLTPDEEQHVGIIHRDETHGHHTGMEYVENYIRGQQNPTTHWAIGNHLVPVGNLKHFVGSLAITQGGRVGGKTVPRLALRVRSIVDPTNKDKNGRAQTYGSGEKTWHTDLDKLFHEWSTSEEGRAKLSHYGIERIPDVPGLK